MRRFLLAVTILTSVASAARVDARPQIAPITENYQSPKMTRLRQLNAMLADALAATPTVDQIQDEQAELNAIDVMTKTLALVKGEIADNHLRPNGAVAFGVVQDNVRLVEARLDFMKRMHKATVALRVLAGVADAHGEAGDDQTKAANGALSSLRDMSGAADDLYAAMIDWHRNINGKLAEVVWPADLPTIELSRKALEAAPVAFHGQISGGRWLPIAVVNVSAPLHALRFYGNFDHVPLRLRGPAKNVDGLVEAPDDDIDSSRGVDVGTYVLEARGKGHAEAVTIDAAITDANTPLDRFRTAQVGDIAADAPIARHRVDAIYPFLDENLSMWERQQLFATAPRTLFVYARDDMDKQDASPQQNSDAMPRKDEPLIVGSNGQTVFDAEGFAWEVHDLKMLVTTPSGAPALPDKIHPLELEFDPPRFDEKKDRTSPYGYFAPGTPGVDKLLAAMIKTEETWWTCTSKVIDKYGGGKANDYDIVTYSNGHVSKVEGMADVAWREADAKCGTKSYEKKLQAFNRQLSDASNKMRAKLLADVRAAWAK